MSEEEQNELLGSVPMDRRRMLKRMLIGSAAIYVAPVVTSFGVDSTVSAHPPVHGSNLTKPRPKPKPTKGRGRNDRYRRRDRRNRRRRRRGGGSLDSIR